MKPGHPRTHAGTGSPGVGAVSWRDRRRARLSVLSERTGCDSSWIVGCNNVLQIPKSASGFLPLRWI
jgi:hypothetical protein